MFKTTGAGSTDMLGSLPERPRAKMAPSKGKKKQKPRRDSAFSVRVRQDSRLYNLTLDVNDLKQEIQTLLLRRQLLRTRALYESQLVTDSSVVRLVSHYFQGFARGYRGPQTHGRQEAFVRSIADTELSTGVTGLGEEMLLEQWRRYTELFHIHQNVVRSLELLTPGDPEEETNLVIRCELTFHGIFTRNAVTAIFPTVAYDPLLMLQVLGRDFVCPMVFLLHFNSRGKLVRHDANADFFPAVLRALSDDHAAAEQFMSDVRVGHESTVGPVIEPDAEEPTERLQPSASLKPSVSSHCGEELVQRGDDASTDYDAPHQRHSLAFLLSEAKP